MKQPPPLPAPALKAGKVAVGLSWLFAMAAVISPMPDTQMANIGMLLMAGLGVTHLIEIIIFREFLAAAKATTNDYIQAFIFGMFHTGGLKIS